ncbi:MAG: hypothetical protein JWN30_1106 [Bacilli bacterium]|nr:hypothetical protein [Bacilli bacterium]
MKIAGVIVEYNPMHNGHVYHLNKARELYQADCLIAVMSGHFLQRGEPAIVSPWYRTQMALASGVDLVFELPVLFSTSSAESFAFGAVSLLDRLNVVDQLCFGSESGEIQQLNELAEFLADPPAAYEQLLIAYHEQGLSYPKAHARALSAWFQETAPGADSTPLDQPNNLLGLEYCKSLLRLNSTIEAVTIRRHGAGFHDEDYAHPEIASATAIRRSIAQGDTAALHAYMPQENVYWYTQAIENRMGPVTWDSFLQALRILILRDTPPDLNRYAHVDEGLGERIHAVFRTNPSNHAMDLIKSIKTKRYTWTHIQRALTAILLGITKTQAKQAGNLGAEYARVLGFNARGQAVLRQIQARASIPVVSRIKQQLPAGIALDLRAQQIYKYSTDAKEGSIFPIRR